MTPSMPYLGTDGPEALDTSCKHLHPRLGQQLSPALEREFDGHVRRLRALPNTEHATHFTKRQEFQSEFGPGLNGYLSEYFRKAFMYRPACRISHTGVCSPVSPRATRSSRSWGAGVPLVPSSAGLGRVRTLRAPPRCRSRRQSVAAQRLAAAPSTIPEESRGSSGFVDLVL